EHGRIALHDQPRNALIARPGCVGYDYPALFSAYLARSGDRIVVGPIDAHDLGAELGYRCSPFVSDSRMHENDCVGPDQFCTGRDRAPVVSIRGASDGQFARDFADGSRVDLTDVDGAAEFTA